MTGDIKFVRIKGRIVPIAGDKVAGQKKRVRESATSTVKTKEATKDLRRAARAEGKSAVKFGRAAVGTWAVSAALAGVGALRRGKKGLVAAIGGAIAFGAGTALAVGSDASLRAKKQYGKDASQLSRGKQLKEARHSTRAGEHARLLERYLEERQAPPPPPVVPPTEATSV